MTKSPYRFTIVPGVDCFWWVLERSRGRGRRRTEVLTGRAVATEQECRADVERVRREIGGAAVVRDRP